MNALLFDEHLADALDDGNARRGWFTDIQRERSADPKLELAVYLNSRMEPMSRFQSRIDKERHEHATGCQSLDCDLVHA